MIRRIVIWMVRVVADTFFRRIDVVGLENVPADGPLIFVGNHPNALMDGWLLTAKCGRWPLHFLASATLWKYRLLGPLLDASGAVPVFRREDHDGRVDNKKAFSKLYEVLESGHCIGIFPEGVSHAESQLVRLKTGAARVALSAADRGNVAIRVIPCGLNYIHRHRFRSQVLIEFGAAIDIGESWIDAFESDEQSAVIELTEHLAEALRTVTLNAPDWRTLRFVQTARRLYKPAAAILSPGDYVELSRRFVEGYLAGADDPQMLNFQEKVENYQARLDMLGLKDYQLRQPVTLGYAFRKIAVRGLSMLALLPLAIPGALVHLPVGWIAATVGERFSYEMDDIATLKVFSTILLLPLLYLAIAILVGLNFGAAWGLVTVVALPFSFIASVRLIEAEAGLLMSMLSILRIARLGSEIDELRTTRTELVEQVRKLAERFARSDTPRLFSQQDFGEPNDN